MDLRTDQRGIYAGQLVGAFNNIEAQIRGQYSVWKALGTVRSAKLLMEAVAGASEVIEYVWAFEHGRRLPGAPAKEAAKGKQGASRPQKAYLHAVPGAKAHAKQKAVSAHQNHHASAMQEPDWRTAPPMSRPRPVNRPLRAVPPSKAKEGAEHLQARFDSQTHQSENASSGRETDDKRAEQNAFFEQLAEVCVLASLSHLVKPAEAMRNALAEITPEFRSFWVPYAIGMLAAGEAQLARAALLPLMSGEERDDRAEVVYAFLLLAEGSEEWPQHLERAMQSRDERARASAEYWLEFVSSEVDYPTLH